MRYRQQSRSNSLEPNRADVSDGREPVSGFVECRDFVENVRISVSLPECLIETSVRDRILVQL